MVRKCTKEKPAANARTVVTPNSPTMVKSNANVKKERFSNSLNLTAIAKTVVRGHIPKKDENSAACVKLS